MENRVPRNAGDFSGGVEQAMRQDKPSQCFEFPGCYTHTHSIPPTSMVLGVPGAEESPQSMGSGS